jgi:hypothetical protein
MSLLLPSCFSYLLPVPAPRERRAAFELSLGPLLWLLLSELYPLSIRGIAMAVGSTVRD